jgi:hypothetical protein
MKPNNARYPHIEKIVDCPSRAASIVEARSLATGDTNFQEIPADADAILKWMNGGEMIQNALPKLDADQREFLISGCTSEDWDNLWFDDE